MCYEVMRLRPPTAPLCVLDVGCGEGKDAVFFARNGYEVDAFDLTETGLEKGRRLADACGTKVRFFQADALTFRPERTYDIVFSSGVLHYLPPALRPEILASYQEHTARGGVHALNAFVQKPFLPRRPTRNRPARCGAPASSPVTMPTGASTASARRSSTATAAASPTSTAWM